MVQLIHNVHAQVIEAENFHSYYVAILYLLC